ncbi:uncharacterized protein LOC124896844 [Capsicum annuum]|uniref:uncharacterized protein LOC124896844 n=1 Tax=Capsicum annuum TaxID=4072 RepID=UPI001FB14ECA|nr:uncharacterized protein LOC124896844 [Capsicum annuum]
MEMLKQLTVNVPLVEALEQLLGYAKFMKDLVMKKRHMSHELVDNLHHCDAISTRSLVQKKAIPGAFTIPYTIGSLDFAKVLCDLRVSINLMPLAIYMKLDLGDHTPTTYYEVDYEVPIILGKPFLTIGSVLIDLRANKLQFRLNDEVVRFDVCQFKKKPKDMSVFSIVDIYYEDEKEVPIEKKFAVKTLFAVLMNFDSEGIEEYEDTVCALTGIESYSYAPKKMDLDLENRPTPPAKLSIDKDQEKTTFSCPYGTFAFKQMPFGLCNAPTTFQRCVMSIFSDIVENTLEVFMDDFSVVGDSFELCLGVHSFLGHDRFYHRFIKDFSKITNPLCKLLERESKFVFDEECKKAFECLKEKLVTAPIIVASDWSKPFKIMCDTSGVALGAVLGQKKEKLFDPIYYVSKALNGTQKNHTVTEHELLAVVYAFEKLCAYLWRIPEVDMFNILEVCHASPIGGHHAGDRIARKVEAIAFDDNKGKRVVAFLKKNIFSRFGVPRTIISDGGSHFCNQVFRDALLKYSVKQHKVAMPYHPQTSGQVDVLTQEIKAILAKTVNASRKDWS